MFKSNEVNWNLITKAVKVIDSCTTEEHAWCTFRYLNLLKKQTSHELHTELIDRLANHIKNEKIKFNTISLEENQKIKKVTKRDSFTEDMTMINNSLLGSL